MIVGGTQQQQRKTKCYFCKKHTGLLVFRCRLCEQPYCTSHRIPEDHLCADLCKVKEEVIKSPEPLVDNHNYIGM